MLTVKQAKDMGVVFVEGDEIEAYGVAYNYDWFTNIDFWYGDPVESFAWRKHTGNEMPCDGDLPVIVMFDDGYIDNGLDKDYDWYRVLKWKPDLEAITKIAERENKIKTATEKAFRQNVTKILLGEIPMKKYKYERAIDLSVDGIAKAMIDGEVFYNANGSSSYCWNGDCFSNSNGVAFEVSKVQFYRKVEVTQKDELAHDIWEFLGDDKLGLAEHLIELGWTKQ